MKDLSYEQRKLALITEVTAAFDGVSREGGISMSETAVIDDRGSSEERAEARLLDTDTRWQDITDAKLCNSFIGSCFLYFLDDIGFQYYIPACMVWCLRHIDDEYDPELPYDGSDVVLESVVSALQTNRGRDHFKLSLFKKLTPVQSKSIAHFLKFTEEWEEKSALKHQLRMEQWQREQMIKEGRPQHEIDATKPKRYVQQNDSTIALAVYWEKFL